MISFLIGLLIFVLVIGLVAYICAWALQKIPVVAEIGPVIVWAIFAILVLLYVVQNFGKVGLGIHL